MYGIIDLARHVLYVIENEGYDEQDFSKCRFEKIVFVSVVLCLKHSFDIRYDTIIYKSIYGASSPDIRRLVIGGALRGLNFNKSREIIEISNNDMISSLIKKVISAEYSNLYYTSRAITSDTVFQNSEFNKLSYEEKKRGNSESWYYGNDIRHIWTKLEMCMMAEIIVEDIDLRIPLTKDEYNAISKYLNFIKSKRINHKESFTWEEINKIRNISQHLIDSVSVFGGYIVD